jgi:hypothetical protein
VANAVANFESALDKTTLSAEQKLEVQPLSDTLCAELWQHFCDHELKHLDALAATAPLDLILQERVATLKAVVEQMKLDGMPAITDLAVT